ncbi:Hypothetical predicted protein, partial [Olea europaea subsp. europaea]
MGYPKTEKIKINKNYDADDGGLELDVTLAVELGGLTDELFLTSFKGFYILG